MISAYPACVYPFVSDSGHSDKEKIYSSLSFLIPFLIERGVYCSFLPNDSKKKYEVTVRPWRYFFFERSQAISKIGGVVDLLFNNILASLWMSSAKLSGRFFATGPNLVLTALVGIAKLRQLEGVLKKDYSTSSDHVPWYYDASKYMALIASSGITAFLMTVMYSLFAESEEVLALESNSTFGIQLLLSSTAFFLIQKLNWEIIKLSYKKFSDLQLLRPIRVEIELGNRVQPQEIQSEIKDFRAFESSLDIEWVEGDVEVSATPAQSSVSRQTSTGLLARLQSGVTFGLSLFQCGRRQRVRPPDVSARDLS
jgi:hypothetical protein